MSEAMYIHPGCGCREYDETPRAHCLACDGAFIPEVEYGGPYRFCPLCGVEFTLCRWRRCVDRMWQPGSAVADFRRRSELGWKVEVLLIGWDGFEDDWSPRSSDSGGDRYKIRKWIEYEREYVGEAKTTRVRKEAGYLTFDAGNCRFRLKFHGPRRKLPG